MPPLDPVSAAPTLAYLDPLSGGMALQVLAASAAAAFLFFKSQGRRLLGFLGLRKTPPAGDSEAE